jgi:hypothetical protein
LFCHDIGFFPACHAKRGGQKRGDMTILKFIWLTDSIARLITAIGFFIAVLRPRRRIQVPTPIPETE